MGDRKQWTRGDVKWRITWLGIGLLVLSIILLATSGIFLRVWYGLAMMVLSLPIAWLGVILAEYKAGEVVVVFTINDHGGKDYWCATVKSILYGEKVEVIRREDNKTVVISVDEISHVERNPSSLSRAA